MRGRKCSEGYPSPGGFLLQEVVVERHRVAQIGDGCKSSEKRRLALWSEHQYASAEQHTRKRKIDDCQHAKHENNETKTRIVEIASHGVILGPNGPKLSDRATAARGLRKQDE